MSALVRRAMGNIKMGKGKPAWLETVANLYPPLTFKEPGYITKRKGKVPKPPVITFPEMLTGGGSLIKGLSKPLDLSLLTRVLLVG